MINKKYFRKTMTKWIECTKKIPKNQQECLIAFEIMPGDPGCGFAYNLATFLNGKFLSWELNALIKGVTHWMPLPKGPDQ